MTLTGTIGKRPGQCLCVAALADASYQNNDFAHLMLLNLRQIMIGNCVQKDEISFSGSRNTLTSLREALSSRMLVPS
jgi:hypothetical protein